MYTNDNAGGFTYRNENTEFTIPAPSQSTWDILLAVLVDAAIALAGCQTGQSFSSHHQGEPE